MVSSTSSWVFTLWLLSCSVVTETLSFQKGEEFYPFRLVRETFNFLCHRLVGETYHSQSFTFYQSKIPTIFGTLTLFLYKTSIYTSERNVQYTLLYLLLVHSEFFRSFLSGFILAPFGTVTVEIGVECCLFWVSGSAHFMHMVLNFL